MQYKITQDLGDRIIAYLADKPYKEVSHLISSLLALPPVEVTQDTQSKGGVENVQGTESQTEQSNGSETQQTQEISNG